MTPDLDPQISCGRIEKIVKETKRDHPEVRLIHFGETILGWFYKKDETRAYHESIAETIPGSITEVIAELAKAHDVYTEVPEAKTAEAPLGRKIPGESKFAVLSTS